ncbi:MAG: DUF2764 domain-containing protein [Candidatus Omnitrophica bacterium]|nr:DUF2764 domain-containing protein [Candidatus Omnitrophota bacterium]MCF7895261.1 DUF2764 domain-containing protein [Candidatus Omnitrophota bacterium]
MDKYYYLITQLPFLKFGEQNYIDNDSFLEEAKKWLSEENFKNLQEANIDDLKEKTKVKFLQEYKKFELTLRRELAAYRENKRRQQEYHSKEVLKKDLIEGNPLEVEKKLLYYRWQQIEESSKDYVFNFEAVIAYFLKLQILEKVLSFDKEKGTKKFDSLIEVEDAKIR